MQQIIVTDPRVFNNTFDDNELGDGAWGAVGQIGGSAAAAGLNLLFGQHGQGGSQVQCHGTTNTCLDTLLGQYAAEQQRLAAACSGPAELIQLMQSVLQTLNNPAVFDQNNDPYLVNTKNQIAARLADVQAHGITSANSGTWYANCSGGGTAAGGGGGTVVVTDPQTGRPVTVTLPPANSGISNTTLLLIGGGAIALLLFLK